MNYLTTNDNIISIVVVCMIDCKLD